MIGQQQVDLERNGSDIVFALIIDGKALIHALEDGLKGKLLKLATTCSSVICCRVSPKQKALVSIFTVIFLQRSSSSTLFWVHRHGNMLVMLAI